MIVLQHTDKYNLYDSDNNLNINMALRQIDVGFERLSVSLNEEVKMARLNLSELLEYSTISVKTSIDNLAIETDTMDLTKLIEDIIATDEGNLTQEDIDEIRQENSQTKDSHDRLREIIEEEEEVVEDAVQQMVDEIQSQVDEIRNLYVEDVDVNVEDIVSTAERERITAGISGFTEIVTEQTKINQWEASGDFETAAGGEHRHVDEDGTVYVWNEDGSYFVYGTEDEWTAITTAGSDGQPYISVERHSDGYTDSTSYWTDSSGRTHVDTITTDHTEDPPLTTYREATVSEDGSTYSETVTTYWGTSEGSEMGVVTTRGVTTDGRTYESTIERDGNGGVKTTDYIEYPDGRRVAVETEESPGGAVTSRTETTTTSDGHTTQTKTTEDRNTGKTSTETTNKSSDGSSVTTYTDSDGNSWTVTTNSDGSWTKTGYDAATDTTTTVSQDANGNGHIHQEQGGTVIQDTDFNGGTEGGDGDSGGDSTNNDGE